MHDCKIERLNQIYKKMVENLEQQLKETKEELVKKDSEINALLKENNHLKSKISSSQEDGNKSGIHAFQSPGIS
ncbi:MAG: hypothetical protein HQM08_08780 [Candidatus Riflebacteria bacterium]|nr:hypothetical protein [Candidatus Riflebacteria bacterium]